METLIKKIKETIDIDEKIISKCLKFIVENKMASYSEVKDLIGYEKETI